MPGFDNIGKGESLPFSFGRKDENSIDGWTCVIEVRSQPGDDSLIGPRAITDRQDQKFVGFLTAAETESLDVGEYRVIADIKKFVASGSQGGFGAGFGPGFEIAAEGSSEQAEHPYKRFKVGSAWI